MTRLAVLGVLLAPVVVTADIVVQPRVGADFEHFGESYWITDDQDTVTVINDYLLGDGGDTAGSVQGFGAGWGGNIGGIVHRDYVTGAKKDDFSALLRDEFGITDDPAACIATPGEGVCLVQPPG